MAAAALVELVLNFVVRYENVRDLAIVVRAYPCITCELRSRGIISELRSRGGGRVTTRIDAAPDIDAYFEGIVHDAIAARQVQATPAAQHYLALLLSDYARGAQGTAGFEEPLTFMLRDALSATGTTRFHRLRRIGDGVLYLLGFFGGGVGRGADRRYVIQVGSSAYHHASIMLRLGSHQARGHDVLGELSAKFARFVEVLTEAADGALAGARCDASSVLALYERWQATGSGQLADALADLGLCPVRAPDGVN